MSMTTPTYQHPWRSDGWEREIYPMPSFPMLSVVDMERSHAWYLDLGFADVFSTRARDGTLVIAHMRWCAFADLLIVPARNPVPEPRGAGIRLCFASVSADALAARAAELGATIVEPPIDRPWNAREVTLLDPEGYRLTFTGPTAELAARIQSGTVPKFEEVLKRMRGRVGPGGAASAE